MGALGIHDIHVLRDGRVATNSIWDEAGKAIGFYKDGDCAGQVQDPSALTGGVAITADEHYLFALRSERKREEKDPFWHGVARYTLDGKVAPWPGGEGRLKNVLFLNPPTDKGGHALTGVAVWAGELFLADPDSGKIRVYRTSDMTPLRQFSLTPACDPPGKMVADRAGRLWIVQGNRENGYRIRCYSKEGQYQNREIGDGRCQPRWRSTAAGCYWWQITAPGNRSANTTSAPCSRRSKALSELTAASLRGTSRGVSNRTGSAG